MRRLLENFPSLHWFVQNDFSAQQKTQEMESVTAAACSHALGYAVLLFSLIENTKNL